MPTLGGGLSEPERNLMGTRRGGSSIALAIGLALLAASPTLAKDGWHGADRKGARTLFYGALHQRASRRTPRRSS